jgi:hypothetical protein
MLKATQDLFMFLLSTGYFWGVLVGGIIGSFVGEPFVQQCVASCEEQTNNIAVLGACKSDCAPFWYIIGGALIGVVVLHIIRVLRHKN